MELEELKKKINEDFNNLKLNLQTLTELRAQYLGKKGPIQEMLLEMKNLPNEEKPKLGEKVNALKQAATELFDAKKKELEDRLVEEQLSKESQNFIQPSKDPPVKFTYKNQTSHFLDKY